MGKLELKLNIENLHEMSGGDRDFEKGLIELFLKEVPISFDKINTALSQKHMPDVTLYAHKLKFPFKILLNSQPVDILQDVENLSKYGKWNAEIETEYRELNNALPKLYTELNKLLKTNYI